MNANGTPDVWQLLFEQTPVIIRGLLGVLTLGLFTVAGILYRWHQADMRRIEGRIDKIEEKMDDGFSEMRRYLVEASMKK